MVKIHKVPPGGKTPIMKGASQPKSAVSFYGATVKADTAKYVVNGADNQPDDTFAGSYTASGSNGTASIIAPTFEPLALKNLVSKNNVLNQCVEAMEVNIDGTGHLFDKKNEDDADNEDELQMLKDFFEEPYPGKSMISVRRALRRDLEDTGVGYLEVARNMNGDVMTMNHLDCENMRLIRFDEPVMATKNVMRNGKETQVTVRVRERRFVQLVNNVRTYFKEFGASRELDRDTGLWAAKGVTLPADKRASEVIYFKINREVLTPYGSPRWINQLPSVLGSRKAEEYNLAFFDAGGLPPVLVLVQGGYLGQDVKDALTAHLAGNGAKHRAAVVEAIAASGSLDSAGTVKVTVERFGAERQADAMFQNYDKACEEHVRAAFRLPPLFIGKAADFNFATAMTGYMTAEAQVFGPERTEFDEKISYVVKALGAKTYRFKSKPMTLSDMENQLKIIEMALSNQCVDPESALETLNKIGGLKLEYKEPPAEPSPLDLIHAKAAASMGVLPGLPTPKEQVSSPTPAGKKKPANGAPASKPLGSKGANPQAGDKSKVSAQRVQATAKPSAAKKGDPGWDEPVVMSVSTLVENVEHIAMLADSWGRVLGLRGACPYDDAQVQAIKSEVDSLEGPALQLFNTALAQQSMVEVQGVNGLAELCGCAADMLAQAEHI
jgi:PBSX family phage portal protein